MISYSKTYLSIHNTSVRNGSLFPSARLGIRAHTYRWSKGNEKYIEWSYRWTCVNLGERIRTGIIINISPYL